MGQHPQQVEHNQRQKTAFDVDIVLGVVFIIMGIGTSTSAIWMLGLIFLAVGVLMRVRAKQQ